MQNAGHHLGDIDFPNSLVEHHQDFVSSLKSFVVEKGFRVHTAVVGVAKAIVSLGNGIVAERCRGKLGHQVWLRSCRIH